MQNDAPHRRVARVGMASKTGLTSAGERAMTRRISAVAACCSSNRRWRSLGEGVVLLAVRLRLAGRRFMAVPAYALEFALANERFGRLVLRSGVGRRLRRH